LFLICFILGGMVLNKYDDDQKFTRYKYGYCSFNSLIILIVLNYIFGLFFNFQWGATKELEIIILIGITALGFINICVYKNVFFYKHNNKRAYSWFYFIIGIVYLYRNFQTYLTYPEEIILDGQIGIGAIDLFFGLLFFSISITYSIRTIIDKMK